MSHWECEKIKPLYWFCSWLGTTNISILTTQVLNWDKCFQQDVSYIFLKDITIPVQDLLKTDYKCLFLIHLMLWFVGTC